MRRLKNIFLTVALLMGLTHLAWGQLESLSDAQIPCDKVFAVDGDVAVGADHLIYYRNLQTIDLKTGTVLSTIEKVIQEFVEVDGDFYFLLREHPIAEGPSVYQFKDGQVQMMDFNEPVFDLISFSEQSLLVAITANGFAVIQDGEFGGEVDLGAGLLNLVPRSSGYLGVTDSSYSILDTDFSVLGIFEIPADLSSFQGAIMNEVLLLTGEVDEENRRPLFIYDIDEAELLTVLDSSGEEARPFHFAVPHKSSGDHFFIAGCGTAFLEPMNFTFPTEAAFIDPETGIYTPSNFRAGLRENIVLPSTIESSGGTLVYGRMGMEGIEPYSISDARIQPLSDVYPGYGGSLDLLLESNIYSPGSLYTPETYVVLEKDGIVYFAGRSPDLGLQIWRSDGTSEGTYAITKENLRDKGFEKCHLSLSGEKILLTAHHRDDRRRLYQVDHKAEPVIAAIDKTRNWEVVYSKNPAIQGGTVFSDLNQSGVNLSVDGSSLLVLNRAYTWHGIISNNHNWLRPFEKIQGFYAGTFIQITNADGSLRSSSHIRALASQERSVGRSFDTGHIYSIVSHRPSDTWVNERRLMEARNGHHLIEFNDQGEEVRTTFLPTGGKDRLAVAQVKIGTDGIYVLGMADRQFTLWGEYENTIKSGYLRAVLMKFNLNHELLWIADSGLDQALFGSGLQNLVVGEDFVCIASGGTSFSVSSSCAHSEWPYQISSFNSESGERKWRRLLDANDVTRITDLVLVGDEWLWAGGYSRGDLSTGNSHLDIQQNYLNCSYNDFLLCINIRENNVSYFKHSDPSRAKFIQDLSFHDDHLYALSMVYEENGFPMPIWANNGRWNVQIDKFTNGGVKVDSLIWPTAMSASHFSDLLRYHKFSFDFHPEGGTVISANRLLNGRVDGFYSPPSSPGATRFNSWFLQRRDIDDLESASLPFPPVSTGDFKLYPNPVFSDSFVLELPSQDVGKYDQLIITDINGRVVSSQNLSGPFGSRLISVDGSLSNGTYLIQLVGSSKSEVKKMVLQR